MTIGPKSSLKDISIAVGAALGEHGIHAVLIGGACATIYSRGSYLSKDADFVLSGRVSRRELDAVMESVGFSRQVDRYVHPDSEFFVEFPAGPLAIGADISIKPVELISRGITILALSPTDSCRDRLAAFYHWGDRQSLEVAVQIALRHKIRWAVIKSWSQGEGALESFEEFEAVVRENRARSSPKK